MRIQLVVAGFNRSLSHTFRSIEECVVRPLRSIDPGLQVSYVLSQTHDAVQSERTGEEGPSETRLPPELDADSIRIIDQSEIDALLRVFLLELLGQAKPPRTRDRELITNMVRFLGILDSAHKEVDPDADYVFFTRPDLRWLEPLRIRQLINPVWPWNKALKGYATASWGGGTAPNDRFALLSQEAVGDYFTRLARLQMFLTLKQNFGSETFLAYAMKDHMVYPVIRARAARVRIGGHSVQESFKPSRIQRRRRSSR